MRPALSQRVAAGQALPGRLEARVWRARMRRLAPSVRVEVVREGSQRGAVTKLDLDAVEERYLLAAAGDGTVGLYDLAEGDQSYGPRRPLPTSSGHHDQPLQRPQGEEDDALQQPVAPFRVHCLQATPRGGSGNGTGSSALAALSAADGAGTGTDMGLGLGSRGPPPASLPGHVSAVTTLQWYPLDTGLFVSGAADGTVRVWDTNALVTAGMFDLGAKVRFGCGAVHA